MLFPYCSPRLPGYQLCGRARGFDNRPTKSIAWLLAARAGRFTPDVAEQVPAVSNVLDAIERRDWARLEALLHPDVHWTTAIEEHLRGRREVLARLAQDPPPAPPAYHELSDELIVRWIDTPG